MVNVIVAKNKYDCEHLLGQFVDESHYDILVEEDTDCYLPADCTMDMKLNCQEGDCSKCKSLVTKDEKKIAFKFRKNYFTKQEQDDAYVGLKDAAKESQNRGLAAGPKGMKLQGRDWATVEQVDILYYLLNLNESSLATNYAEDIEIVKAKAKNKSDTRGYVWLSSEVIKNNFNFDEWLIEVVKKPAKDIVKEANFVYDNYISDTTYANPVYSGVAGWYDRYPRIPYGRATSYTRDAYDKFKKAFPFLQALDKGFKELLPWRWGNQRKAADTIDQRYLVPETVFTTITVNNTFRTACHRDAGDFTEGLSNLLVLSNDGRFTGGYLVFPEVRVAVNVRPGDLLLVNNHEIIHGNTPIVCEEGSERISIVCYLREGMLELGSKEYEDLRYEFVESRRKNPNHPLQRKLWNGVSEGMWNSQEWFNYLEEKGGKVMLDKYHPQIKESTLDGLFS